MQICLSVLASLMTWERLITYDHSWSRWVIVVQGRSKVYVRLFLISSITTVIGRFGERMIKSFRNEMSFRTPNYLHPGESGSGEGDVMY